MFTGLITHCGRLLGVEKQRLLLEVEASFAAERRLGESVAVDGCCLSVVSKADSHLSFDLGPETLRRTGLGQRVPGDFLNLELSLPVGGRLEGHFVLGHVDCTLPLAKLEKEEECYFLSFRIPVSYRKFCTSKGSVAIRGVSLTIARLEPLEEGEVLLSVMLLPVTWQRTNFQFLREGEPCEFEFDYLAKVVLEAQERS